MLILLFNRPNGIKLDANSNIDQMFDDIRQRKPMYGDAFPKEFCSFIFFGKGIKCINASAAASVWTLTGARGVSRKKTGRDLQRQNGRVLSKRKREEADAKHRDKSENNHEKKARK